MTARTSLQFSLGAAGPVLNLNWRAEAACRAVDPELLFPPVGASPARIAQAKAVCASCPVRAECLDFAETRHIEHGVWGGLTRNERRAQRASSPRQLAPVTVASKRCCACEDTKAAAEFHRDRNRPDGLYPRCKICRSSGGTAVAA